VAAAVSCGCEGGSGDSPSEPVADPYGQGQRLHELLGPATEWVDLNNEQSEGCANVPRDRNIYVTGLTVTAVDRYDEIDEGQVGNIYAQDTMADPVPYSGITIYAPAFSPPDLRVIESDVMDLYGVLTEFPGPSAYLFEYCRTLPEVGGAMEFRFDGAEQSATLIDVGDLGTYEGARQWLGMLVTLTDVELLADPRRDSKGRYTVQLEAGAASGPDIPVIANELFDLETADQELNMHAGMKLSSVTGIVTFFFNVHISPRSAEDIEP